MNAIVCGVNMPEEVCKKCGSRKFKLIDCVYHMGRGVIFLGKYKFPEEGVYSSYGCKNCGEMIGTKQLFNE